MTDVMTEVPQQSGSEHGGYSPLPCELRRTPSLQEMRRRINATTWPERETVRMRRRACGSRRCRSSPAIGRQNTTGERSRRD